MTIKDVIGVFEKTDSINIVIERENPFRKGDMFYETLFDGTLGELTEMIRERGYEEGYEEGYSVKIREAKLYIDGTIPKMSVIV